MLYPSTVRCLLLVILLSSLAAPHSYAQDSTPPDPPPAPHDAYGNAVVGEDGTKLNYVVGADGFAALELDAAGQTRSHRTLPTDPFNKVALAEAQPQASVVAAPSSAASSNDYLAETWRTGILGTGIGASNMTARDIDNDDALKSSPVVAIYLIPTSSGTFCRMCRKPVNTRKNG